MAIKASSWVLLTLAMEVRSALSGKHRSRWEGSMIELTKKDHGAVTLVLDRAKVFERVSLPAVWTCATHVNIFPRSFCVCYAVLRAPLARSI